MVEKHCVRPMRCSLTLRPAKLRKTLKVSHKFQQWTTLLTIYVYEKNFLIILVSVSKALADRSGIQERIKVFGRLTAHENLPLITVLATHGPEMITEPEHRSGLLPEFRFWPGAGA